MTTIMSYARFDAEAKGCDASGMARRFGAGEMIFVKAHHEDALDLVVGVYTALGSGSLPTKMIICSATLTRHHRRSRGSCKLTPRRLGAYSRGGRRLGGT